MKVQYDATKLQVEKPNMVAEDEGTNYDVNLSVFVDMMGKITMSMTKVQPFYLSMDRFNCICLRKITRT